MASSRLNPSLEALKAWAVNRGASPSQREWNVYAKEHHYLGCVALWHHTRLPWTQLCKTWGIPVADPLSEMECIAAVQAAAKTWGPFLTKRQYEEWAIGHPGQPRAGTVTRRVRGSWNAAKAAAALPCNAVPTIARQWTDEE